MALRTTPSYIIEAARKLAASAPDNLDSYIAALDVLDDADVEAAA